MPMIERLTGSVNVAPEDLMTDASSATTMAELAVALEGHGLFWPPATLVPAERTLGQLLSHAPGGNTRLGSTIRRYVLALDVRLADGSTTRAGARTVKCVTGYDLKQAFIGSRGCLGTILGAILRLETEANRVAVEHRIEQDFAGLEARRTLEVPTSRVATAGGAGTEAADGWREVLARLKAELDPAGVLPSIDELWPRDEPVSRNEAGSPGEE
jgi:FAD/FMN-containing dehydrogenase